MAAAAVAAGVAAVVVAVLALTGSRSPARPARAPTVSSAPAPGTPSTAVSTAAATAPTTTPATTPAVTTTPVFDPRTVTVLTRTTAAPAGSALASMRSGAIGREVVRRFGLTITSGYRSPAHNAAVGGAEGSYHTRGTPQNPGAYDFVGPLPAMRRALDWAAANLPQLAEGIIHSVCLAEPDRPWRVSDGGLHLHLAFAQSDDDPNLGHPDLYVDLYGGCRTAERRVQFAIEAIDRLHAAGALDDEQVLRDRITTTRLALGGTYGPLSKRVHDVVAAIRSDAQAQLAARTQTQTTTTPG